MHPTSPATSAADFIRENIPATGPRTPMHLAVPGGPTPGLCGLCWEAADGRFGKACGTCEHSDDGRGRCITCGKPVPRPYVARCEPCAFAVAEALWGVETALNLWGGKRP